MSKLRRYFKPNDIVFVTIVSYNRNKIIIENADLLKTAIQTVKTKINYDIIAYVYLPDHIHFLIDSGGNDLTKIIQRVKMSFGAQYRIRNNLTSGRIWQNRYWDHIIRNQDDMNKHIDYIHYNPVKHRLAKSPFDWSHSSLHEYRDNYPNDWGSRAITFDNIYGE